MAGYTAARLAFAVAFLSLILAAVYLHYNPLEKAKQEKDEKRARYAQNLLQAVSGFYQQKGRLPWADDLASGKPALQLKFTKVNDAIVGICGDSKCTKSGKLAERGGLYPIPREADNMFIAKGTASADPVYVCFLPDSDSVRAKTGNLYSIERYKNQTFTGDLPLCRDGVNWEDEYCFVCLK